MNDVVEVEPAALRELALLLHEQASALEVSASRAWARLNPETLNARPGFGGADAQRPVRELGAAQRDSSAALARRLNQVGEELSRLRSAATYVGDHCRHVDEETAARLRASVDAGAR